MRKFLDEDFLLTTDTARRLYHDIAEGAPILDYHCHLNPAEIAENLRFRNIGHLMLGGDHYKWRAMAALGLDERLIRGDAMDREKFFAYARMLPLAAGNPLYHWTHLELKRVFGINEPLNADSAARIWDQAGEMLSDDRFRARGLIERFHVEVLCTTDDPADSLEHHARLAADRSFPVRVLPAFRPDKALNVDRAGYAAYIGRLGQAAGRAVKDVEGVILALGERADFFHAAGARLSDHGLEPVPFGAEDWDRADRAMRSALAGAPVDPIDAEHYKTVLLVALGRKYVELNWTQQYHIGALRSPRSTALARFGPDTGFDAMGDAPFAEKLTRLLDAQDRACGLPRTILYTLNPAANYPLAAAAGTFQGGSPGKIQFGSGWWFCDHKAGMREQLGTLSALGLLGTFVGMLTDSRSFVSYPRHEYFRRILCDMVGGWVEDGEYPQDWTALKSLVLGVCCQNARAYFAF